MSSRASRSVLNGWAGAIIVWCHNCHYLIFYLDFLINEFYSWKSYRVILMKMKVKFGMKRRSVQAPLIPHFIV